MEIPQGLLDMSQITFERVHIPQKGLPLGGFIFYENFEKKNSQKL